MNEGLERNARERSHYFFDDGEVFEAAAPTTPFDSIRRVENPFGLTKFMM
jgi:hypothetical protein